MQPAGATPSHRPRRRTTCRRTRAAAAPAPGRRRPAADRAGGLRPGPAGAAPRRPPPAAAPPPPGPAGRRRLRRPRHTTDPAARVAGHARADDRARPPEGAGAPPGPATGRRCSALGLAAAVPGRCWSSGWPCASGRESYWSAVPLWSAFATVLRRPRAAGLRRRLPVRQPAPVGRGVADRRRPASSGSPSSGCSSCCRSWPATAASCSPPRWAPSARALWVGPGRKR